jgi:hypothetical protein
MKLIVKLRWNAEGGYGVDIGRHAEVELMVKQVDMLKVDLELMLKHSLTC